MDTIPINAIERVEVLRDGASAQYGSDAIAGVINVILKSADHGGSAAADVGQTGDGDGFTHGGGGTSDWPSAIAASSTSPPNIASRSARCAAASMSAPVGATTFPWAIPRSTGNRWRSTPVSGWATISRCTASAPILGARPPRRPTIAWLRWRRRCIRTASRRARTATRTTMRSSPGCAASVCWMPGTGT
ncbi:TonB-dependent receptor plug domain-containing protein [Pseudomonas aeruginosa]|nr:TonB-dependent receptor plug domain-containing protein [Pseudomonas aeruginosa]